MLRRIIEKTISHYGGKPAYIINGEITTYAEMDRLSQSIATGLAKIVTQEMISMKRPVRVCVNLPRESHFISCIVACVKLGCSYVPMDTLTPGERVNFVIKDAEVDYIINEDNIQALIDTPPATLLPSLHKDYSEAYMIYTSGTTGVPKGVSIPYSSLVAFLQTYVTPERMNITEESVMLMFASINFDSSISEVFPALYVGATLVVATERERHDIEALCEMICKYNVTAACLPPSLLAVFPAADIHSLRTVVSAGEALPQGVARKFLDSRHIRFINGYGPTENTVCVTLNVLTNDTDIKSIGKPLEGVVCHVVDEKMNELTDGEVGELLVGGRHLANGYWNRDELNAKAFVPNPFAATKDEAPRLYHSGDRVSRNADGSYNYHGRMDSQVKLHGYRVELSEISSRLEEHPSVRRAYTRVEKLGNDSTLVEYVCLSEAIDIHSLKEWLAEYVPHYMVPALWNIVDSFDLTINGKIDTSKLVNDAWQRLICNVDDEQLNDNEQIIAREVAHIIGADDVNVDADLIDELALTSLQIMQIPQDLEPCGCKVTVDDIYRYRTIRKIAANHIYRISFWYNNPEEHPERRVMIYFTGHPHFGYCEDLCRQFADKYNIFVIEGFHTILNFMSITTPELIGIYKLIVKPVEEKYDVAAYVGYCLGGEQALLVAHDLHNETAVKPLVAIVDGEVRRERNTDHIIHLTWPTFTDAQNAMRSLIDETLQITFPENVIYNGPVVSFVCTEFDEQQTMDPESQKDVPLHIMDYYRERFRTSASLWREEYPHADVIMIKGSHFTCMHNPLSIGVVSDYIHSHC